MDEVALDGDGFVVATASTVPPHPFCVLESSDCPGRYFFFNSETFETHWRLKPWGGGTGGEQPEKSNNTQPLSPDCVDRSSPHHLGNSEILKLTSEGLIVEAGLALGGFGAVVRVAHKDTNGQSQHFAMKCVPKIETCYSSKEQEVLRNELKALAELPSSPFLLRGYLAFESASTVFMVTDLISGGDLFYHLDQLTPQGKRGFPEHQARILLAEVATGLCHMHDHDFIHLDIKVENIMLTSDGHVKLVDYGLCCEVKNKDEFRAPPVGSLVNMAPEQIREGLIGRYTDWWAFGILGHELLTSRSPWSTLTDKMQIKYEIANACFRPPLKGFSLAASEFLCGLLSHDQHGRLGYAESREVLRERFFAEALDMVALERGVAPPSGIVGHFSNDMDGDLKLERDQALEKYVQMSTPQPPSWSMHLKQVSEHPKVLTTDSLLMMNTVSSNPGAAAEI